MHASGRLPAPVYETLPKLYMAGGVATFIGLPVGIATVSGTLLLATGAWVSLLRRYNRQQSSRRQDRVRARSLRGQRLN
jgi:hypothetical protein